jgi:hypothetical protein
MWLFPIKCTCFICNNISEFLRCNQDELWSTTCLHLRSPAFLCSEAEVATRYSLIKLKISMQCYHIGQLNLYISLLYCFTVHLMILCQLYTLCSIIYQTVMWLRLVNLEGSWRKYEKVLSWNLLARLRKPQQTSVKTASPQLRKWTGILVNIKQDCYPDHCNVHVPLLTWL